MENANWHLPITRSTALHPITARKPSGANCSVSPCDTTAAVATADTPAVLPPLSNLISVHDFENVAKRALSPKTFTFYASASTDSVTQRANANIWREILLRARVLRNVKDVNIRRSILGCNSSAPFFVCPAAMAKLAHPDGELAIARGCGAEGIIQVISSNASYSLAEIVKVGRPNQPFFFQLYVNFDRGKTEQVLRQAKSLGVKAIVLTIDAPVPGKREADEKMTAENVTPTVNGQVAINDSKGGGLGRLMGKYIDPTLSWTDLKWLREISDLPVVLKGIQTAADVRMAVEHGIEAIILSNHGGRNLDTVQPAICTLLEIHRHCPEVLDKLEIYIDGGITRGTDILKALALGATAVGIARPYLYALPYGQNGIEHLTQILKDELITALKLSGIIDVEQAHPGMVNTSTIDSMVWSKESHPWISWKPKTKL